MRELKFHPKALEFLREQSIEIRKQVGESLRNLQKGISLGMPLSRPMPSVAIGAHEIRVKDASHAVRVFYTLKYGDAVLVFHGFQKKTEKTPSREIEIGRKRLQELLE